MQQGNAFFEKIKKQCLDLWAQLNARKNTKKSDLKEEDTSQKAFSEKNKSGSTKRAFTHVTQEKAENITAGIAGLKKSFLSLSFKKKCFLILLVVGLLFALWLWHTMDARENNRRAATAFLARHANDLVLTQLLGEQLQVTGQSEGPALNVSTTGTVRIPVAGSQGKGMLEVHFTQGKVTALFLSLPNGKIFDILVLDKQAEAEALKKEAQVKAEHNFNQAIEAMNKQAYSEAISRLQHSIELNYRVAASYEYWGWIASQQQDYAVCIKAFQAYVKLKPKDANAYYQLAYCYLQRYDKAAAIQYLIRACQLGNKDACSAKTQIEAMHAKLGLQ